MIAKCRRDRSCEGKVEWGYYCKLHHKERSEKSAYLRGQRYKREQDALKGVSE